MKSLPEAGQAIPPERARRGPLALILAMIGPAIVMTAGIMGPGSTTSLLLAGAYFRYDMLWITIAILPAVVVCLDSGARVGILSGHKGMLSIIRDEIHPALTWIVLLVMILFNVFVNMSMFSVMTASLMSIFGYYPPDAPASVIGALQSTIGSQSAPAAVRYAQHYKLAELGLAVLVASGVLGLLITGSYKRAQRLLAGLLFLVFVCYFTVAFRGFLEIREILAGLKPRIPPDLPVPGTGAVRNSFAAIMAIAGGALAPAPILSFSYFTSDDRARIEDMPRMLRKNILTLGFLFGACSVLVLVAGGSALYPLPNHAAISKVHEAGRVLTRALPFGAGLSGPKLFAVGLFICGMNTMTVVTQLMCYFCLDAFRQNWRYTRDNKKFRRLLVFWILVPALLAPLWEFPALLKLILLMGLNIVLVPMAVAIVLYLINKRSIMREHKAGLWRNALLLASLALALWLAFYRSPFFHK